jgi:hypothetical protein
VKKQRDVVQDQAGNAVAQATITVTGYADGLPAELFADADGASPYPSNQVLTDALGIYEFYAADGRYNIAAASGGTTVVEYDVEIVDAAAFDARISALEDDIGDGGSLRDDLIKTQANGGSNLVGFEYQLGYDTDTSGQALVGLYDSIQDIYGTVNQIDVDDTVPGRLTWSLPDELVAPGTLEVVGTATFDADVIFEENVTFNGPQMGRENAYTFQPGEIGEFISDSLEPSVSMTTGVVVAPLTITITKGHWEIDAVMVVNPASGLVGNFLGGGVNTDPAALPSSTFYQTVVPLNGTYGAVPSAVNWAFPIVRRRFFTSTTVNISLCMLANFSGALMTCGGYLAAKRYA